MSWNVVDSDFGGEETANFGTRQESGTALFQLHTVATISNSKPDTVCKLPHITSCGSSSGMCIAADSQASMFDENCQKQNASLSFESIVELAAWVDELPFLVIAERNGTVHFIHAGLNRVVFSQALISRSEDDLECDCFKQINITEGPQGKHHLLVLTAEGTLFRFSNVDFRELDHMIQNGDFASAKQLQDQICMEETDLTTVHTEGVRDLTTVTIGGHMHIVTCGGGNYVLAMWKSGPKIEILRRVKPVKFIVGQLIKCIAAGKFIFTLDEEHKLCLWNTTPLLLSVWPLYARDFFISGGNSTGDTRPQFQLVMLSVPDKNGRSYLKVYDLPSMQCTYSLAVGSVSVLATIPSNQDSIYFVEGRKEDDSNSHLVTMVMVRCLTEALPETRFHRLLHKKQFEEAEKFAKLFNLDLELVHRSQANALLDQASAWSLPEAPGEGAQTKLCDDLMACLEKIKDVEFVVGVCSKATMPTLEETAKILQYARARFSKVKGKEEMDSKTQILCSLIVEALHRLATFDRVYGSSYYSPSTWDAFLNGDLLQELELHLSRGHLARASVLWNRHREDFVIRMSEDMLESLLRAVPGDTPSNDIIPWLRDDMIPFVCHHFQHGKKTLIVWIEERVVCLEVTEKATWPGNGLELAELMLRGNQRSLASAGGASFAHSLTECQTSRSDCKEGFERLKELVHCLQELKKLHTKYKCYLTLDQFRMETTTSIPYRMLDRVAALELVPGAIGTYITPYAKDNKLEVDNLLRGYIQDLLSDSSLLASYEASLEAKAIKVITCIKDLECQCEAIYVLMQKASVPWSRAMEQLVQYGLGLKHPLVAQLQERFRLMELRDTFMKYDLRSVALGNPESMKIVLKHIMKTDGPSVMDDALRVVEARPELNKMDAFILRSRHLVLNNQIDQCLQLLTSLPHQEAVLCLTRLLAWTETVLSDQPDRFPDEAKESRLLVGETALRLLEMDLYRGLCQDSVSVSRCHRQRHHIECMLHLQKEHGLLIPLDCYCSEAYRSKLLKKFVVEHFRDSKSGARKKEKSEAVERKMRKLKPGNFIPVLRVGALLGVEASELQGQLALRAAGTGQIATALKMCRELSETQCSADVAHTVYQVCHAVCSQWSKGHESLAGSAGGKLARDLLHLMQRATASCNQDLLVDCLDLCNKIRSLTRISDQCESGEYGISVQIGAAETKKDPYHEYTLESFFKEDSLVLAFEDAIPLSADFVVSCQPKTRPRTALPHQQSRVAGTPVPLPLETDSEKEADTSPCSHIVRVGATTNYLYQTLREHNQCGLAFHHLMQSLATTLVHVSINKGTSPVDDQVVTMAIEKDVKRMAELVRISKPTMTDLSSVLLNKIFSCRNVDTFLALCYLSILPVKVAKEQIKKLVIHAGQNYRRIIAIAKVGCDMAKLHQDPQLQLLFQELHTNASWGDRLLKLKISFKEAFNNAEKRCLLLPQLITHPETSLELIAEYCKDFSLDEQDALMTYIRLLLLPSDGSPSGDEDRGLKPQDATFIKSALVMIHQNGPLVKMLVDNIDKMNCYDYERLRLVLYIINSSGLDVTDQTHSTEGLKLLDYLEAYTRTKPPTEFEIKFQPHNEEEGLLLTPRPLPPLSKTRLPFHPLLRGGQWKILSCELSEETLGQLLPIAEVLKLSIDQLYVTTIQNMIRTRQHALRGSSSPEAKAGDEGERHMQPPRRLDLETLAKVQDLLFRVQHLEMAVATARFIAKELPVGKEKVMALKICEGLAHRWKEVSLEESADRQKACATYERLVGERKAVSTEETLHRHGLGEPPYTQMIATPAKLIFALYEHGSIEQRIQGSLHDFPDINGAAQEIAKINNCNMDKIRVSLTRQWLPQPVASQQEETTMNFSFGSPDVEEIPEEERSLMRLKYLLQHEEEETVVKFLLNVTFKELSNNLTRGGHVRALRCLFYLADDALIQKVSKQSVAELREHMKNLVYLGEFEALNIAMDLQTFISSNKAGLVRGLWRNHNHEPRSVQLISKLCLEYGVHDKHLWSSILLQLQKCGMLDYLEYVLVQLAGMVELRSIPCLPRVWSVVLSAPFTSVCPPLSEQQAQKCRSVLSLLQRCPVLFDLDLVRLSSQFVRVGMDAEALACLLNMPEKSKRDVQIQTLLQERPQRVLDALAELKAKNQPLPEHEQVVAEVQKHLEGV